MSVSSILTRLHALAGVKDVAHNSDPVFEPVTTGWERLVGMRWTSGGLSEFRNVLFWVVAVVLLILFAVITNPTESSFRSHLTELSFRRHLVDIRSSDDSSAVEDEPHVPSTPRKDHGTDTPPIAPFRFANHVAISLRTPTLLYKTFLLFSLAITSPLSPPPFLSDPSPVSRGKHASGQPRRDRTVVFFGFMGHWTFMGQVPRQAEWVWRHATEGGREKGGKKVAASVCAGVMEMRAVPGKEELPAGAAKTAIALQSFASSKHMLKSDSLTGLSDNGTLPLHPHQSLHSAGSLSPESRLPSTAKSALSPPASPADTLETPSPVVTALKADLLTAQATLVDLKNALVSHEESVKDAHAHLQETLEDLRNRRKEDDADRQELKTRTKSLEEQKRQAEAARREAEKKLRVVEGARDGIEAKISAALNEIGELKGNLEGSERNIRVLQEEGMRFFSVTRDAAEGKKGELGDYETQLVELDGVNEELVRQVKDAEEKLQVVVQQGEEARRVGPEEEMMMMAAAYEVAAQEGYLYGHQQSQSNQWANQAAAYMAEAGMPYLGQTYTARPAHAKHQSKLADLSGFEDFGPGTADHVVKDKTTPPASDSESDIYGHDPGSPNGGISRSFSANLLPQGLFKSLEGDQTPLGTDADEEPIASSTLEEALNFDPPSNHAHVDGHDSGSESSDEHDPWGSPAELSKDPKPLSGSLFAPPTTTPPAAHSLSGLPASAGARRWFSGSTSAENVNSFSFMQPTSTTSNDSLSLTGGYEASAFAPSASEKKALALKWGPLSKYRWAGANRDPQASLPGLTRSSSTELDTNGSGWLSSRFGNANAHAHANLNRNVKGNKNVKGNGNLDSKSDLDIAEQSGEEDERQDKKPFRFFSLRKPKEQVAGGRAE